MQIKNKILEMTQIQQNNQIIIYQSKDGQISFNVNVFEETVWLTQKQMAELFDKDLRTINEHIINIFNEGELERYSTIRKFRIVQKEGIREVARDIEHYNLDVIISVGYRVKSQRGTQFRIWATKILKQYMLNGYAFNDPRIDMILEHIAKFKSKYEDDQKRLYEKISEIANKPIEIHNHNYNQISLANNELEEKIIKLLDQLIKEVKPDQELAAELQEVKEVIKASSKDQRSKNKIKSFFTRLGDKDSDLYKTVQGAGIAKKIITELIKLGEKLKDLIF